jgi:L-ascorbate metabolism protein UlaG (beta-lactamase superfamily)
MSTQLFVTRVVNACVLLEFDSDVILTDPYFDKHWFIRLREPIGLQPSQLPVLTAILGGHGAPDHWHPRSLAAYPHKTTTPVFVANRSMQRKAIAAGFPQTEVLPWKSTRTLSPRLQIDVIPAHTALGMTSNSYVLSTPDLRVFIGPEARDLQPLRDYRSQRPPVDVALLPIDGSALLGYKLVMSPTQALEATRILGAHVLIPIHYALNPIPPLLQTPGSPEQLLQRADADTRIVTLDPGHRWPYA